MQRSRRGTARGESEVKSKRTPPGALGPAGTIAALKNDPQGQGSRLWPSPHTTMAGSVLPAGGQRQASPPPHSWQASPPGQICGRSVCGLQQTASPALQGSHCPGLGLGAGGVGEGGGVGTGDGVGPGKEASVTFKFSTVTEHFGVAAPPALPQKFPQLSTTRR